FPPLSWLEIFQSQIADCGSHKSQRGMPNCSGHVAYLAIASFRQYDLDPSGGNILAKTNRWISGRKRRFLVQQRDLRGTCTVILNLKSRSELAQRDCVGDTLYWHAIGSLMSESRIGEAMWQLTIIGENQQAFTIAIQPSRRINATDGYVV